MKAKAAYTVIFRATLDHLDDDYVQMAANLRQLAMEKYGCLDFISFSAGGQEVAISYWQSMEHIRSWSRDPVHRQAKERACDSWYHSWQLQICKIESSRYSDQI
ncbi:MAG: DUF4188 domain-containing protein [Leptospiraceae bacterium]|nr:DUF4188 domain-containing protein [Leptospiraceae bacterium]